MMGKIPKDNMLSLIVKILMLSSIFNFSHNCFAFSVQSKGTWLGRQWLERYDPVKVEMLAGDLSKYRISQIYPALSFGAATKVAGTEKIDWINHHENARKFMKHIRRLCPGIKIYPF